MTDAERLQAIYRHESRTLLQYMLEASPWCDPADATSHHALLDSMKAERLRLAELATVMQSQQIALPYLGAFTAAYTSYNFCSLRSVLPLLLAETRATLPQLIEYRQAMTDANPWLTAWVEHKEKLLHTLEAWSQSLTTPRSA